MNVQQELPPVFISETSEFQILKKDKNNILLEKYKKSQINLAFDILKNVLYKRYGSEYSIPDFIKNANQLFTESETFSKYMLEYFELKNWSNNTRKTLFQVLKTIFKNIAISDSFIKRLTISKSVCLSKYDNTIILKREYHIMNDDHPVKKRLTDWITIIKQKSKNKSPQSIKSIISFYINKCIPKINIRLECWDISTVDLTEKTVKSICVNLKYFNWFNLFCSEILLTKLPFTRDQLNINNENNFYDGDYNSGDKHVILIYELEQIYKETQKSSIFDQLMFMLMITTGMRVGGFINIKLNHVCKIHNNTINILDSGRTLEKGNKWFEFIINNQVKILLQSWIIKERSSNSDFLFPSFVTKYGHISDNTVRLHFKNLCTRAGVSGKHIHLHALRHSYAHILLNCGNEISVISKLLNHSNTQTTEHFYLKETATQVVNRANIPWLNPENKPSTKIIPDFLNNKHFNEQTKKNERKKKRLETINNLMVKITT